MLRTIHLLTLVLFSICLVSCTVDSPGLATAPWEYADLRLLDPADASEPTHDLIALYTREIGDDLQIRLDLLDHATLPDYDLYITLDSGPGGVSVLPLDRDSDINWDTLLIIPATGELRAVDDQFATQPQAGLHVVRDPVQDTLVISLRQAALGIPADRFKGVLPTQVQVFLTPPESRSPSDSIGPTHTGASPPPPVKTLLVFWNSFPANSPMLSLRRWDGAHTGPYGGRHGLFNLLRTAHSANIPLALLDLKAPASLAALSHAGGLELVAEMEENGLLITPEYLPDLPIADGYSSGQVADRILVLNREITNDFDLPNSLFLSTHAGLLPSRASTRLVFLRSSGESPEEGGSSIVETGRWREQLIIPVPVRITPAEGATPAGPSLDLRRAWLETAVRTANAPKNGSAPVLLLGGDLPASTWGAPQAARATFRYINAHPWIRPLNAHDLLSARPGTGSLTYSSEEVLRPGIPIGEDLITELRSAPGNQISRAAWNALEALYGPVFPNTRELPALRHHYLSNIWSLIAAAQWAENPGTITDCYGDIDRDGEPECILASEEVYAQFEIESGALTYLFARLGSHSDQTHQFIAPSSQFSVGLSDPASWDRNRGQSADPAVLPGAFSETGLNFQPQLSGPEPALRFTSADGKVIKEFKITDQGIEILYQTTLPPAQSTIQIPIALDPWERFSANWSTKSISANNYISAKDYISGGIPDGWWWGFEGGTGIQLTTRRSFEVHTFQDTLDMFAYPENPNQDYPPGHSLPYPLAIINISTNGETRIEMRFTTAP